MNIPHIANYKTLALRADAPHQALNLLRRTRWPSVPPWHAESEAAGSSLAWHRGLETALRLGLPACTRG